MSYIRLIIFMFLMFVITYFVIAFMLYLFYFHLDSSFLHAIQNNPVIVGIGVPCASISSVFGGILYSEHQHIKKKK